MAMAMAPRPLRVSPITIFDDSRLQKRAPTGETCLLRLILVITSYGMSELIVPINTCMQHRQWKEKPTDGEGHCQTRTIDNHDETWRRPLLRHLLET
jgi:hypothetical protein